MHSLVICLLKTLDVFLYISSWACSSYLILAVGRVVVALRSVYRVIVSLSALYIVESVVELYHLLFTTWDNSYYSIYILLWV